MLTKTKKKKKKKNVKNQKFEFHNSLNNVDRGPPKEYARFFGVNLVRTFRGDVSIFLAKTKKKKKKKKRKKYQNSKILTPPPPPTEYGSRDVVDRYLSLKFCVNSFSNVSIQENGVYGWTTG